MPWHAVPQRCPKHVFKMDDVRTDLHHLQQQQPVELLDGLGLVSVMHIRHQCLRVCQTSHSHTLSSGSCAAYSRALHPQQVQSDLPHVQQVAQPSASTLVTSQQVTSLSSTLVYRRNNDLGALLPHSGRL